MKIPENENQKEKPKHTGGIEYQKDSNRRNALGHIGQQDRQAFLKYSLDRMHIASAL